MQKLRSHPHLFFSAEDLPELRDRGRRPPHDVCQRLLLDTATHLLQDDIPDEPAEDEPHADLLFHAAGFAMQNYGQVLAFAHLLSGDPRYAARARDWALAYASWSRWALSPVGLPAAHGLLGMSLVYDWLGGFLETAECRAVRRAMVHQFQIFYRHQRDDFNADPASPLPARLGTCASWIRAAAAGLASLALLHEENEASSWVAAWSRFFQNRLLPASFGHQGEFQEGTGWDVYALRHSLPFFDALKHCYGQDLFSAPGIRAYTDFLLHSRALPLSGHAYRDCPDTSFYPPSALHYRYLLLRLAKAFQSGELFQLGTRDGLAVPRGTPLDWFYHYRHRVPYESGRWYTIALGWDAAQGRCSLRVDHRSWDFTVANRGVLERVDGLCFSASGSGAGFRLRHPGVRSGTRPATVLLEQDVELRISPEQGAPADWAPADSACLRTSQLHMDFPAASTGMVWFQICKADLDGQAEIRLTCGADAGPGLQLTACGLLPFQGADFLRIDDDGLPLPPASWSSGQIWFDGPWDYLWCDPTLPSLPPGPWPSRHFVDAGLIFLRGEQEDDPELRFRAGPAVTRDPGDQNGFSLRVGGEWLTGARPRITQAQPRPSPERLELDGLFTCAFASNTPLVEGHPQTPASANGQWLNPQSAAHSGRVERFFASPFFDAVVGEAGGAYPGLRGFRRRIAYIKPDYFVLDDSIVTDGDARIEWCLNALGNLSLAEDRFVIRGKRGALEFFLLRPEFHAEERHGMQGDLLSLPLEGREARLLALLAPAGDADRPPIRPERVGGRGGSGARLMRGGLVDFILFRDREQGTMNVSGMRSDAEILFARRSGRNALSLYSLVAGTQLRTHTELVRLSSSANLVVRQTASRLNATLQAPEDLEIRLALGRMPRTVRLDGICLDADAYAYVGQGRRLVLTVPIGIHEIDVACR